MPLAAVPLGRLFATIIGGTIAPRKPDTGNSMARCSCRMRGDVGRLMVRELQIDGTSGQSATTAGAVRGAMNRRQAMTLSDTLVAARALK